MRKFQIMGSCSSKGRIDNGVFILNRFGKTEDDAVRHFTEILHNYTLLDEKGRVREKIMAKESANLADWKELVSNYFDAHNAAIEKIWG